MLDLLVKDYTEYQFLTEYGLWKKRILNVGSSSVRYGGANCVNIDIQNKEGVDVVCDMHDLSRLGVFDVIICNGALQYSHDPLKVANEFYHVLKPGGYLFVDAPWIQPYCPDTPDKLRFSEDALRAIFSKNKTLFNIVKIGPSIRPGSAFAMLGIWIAGSLTKNRYVNYILRIVATIMLYPFRWIRTTQGNKTAGAFYMIARKI